MGTTAQTLPLGTVEREANVPSWTKLSSSWPAASLAVDMILGVEFHGQEEVGPSKAHSPSHSRKSLGSAQSGRAAPVRRGGGLAPLILPPCQCHPKHFVVGKLLAK